MSILSLGERVQAGETRCTSVENGGDEMTKPLTPAEVDALLTRPKLFGMDLILDERVQRGTIEFRDEDGKLLSKIIDMSDPDADDRLLNGDPDAPAPRGILDVRGINGKLID